MSKVNSFICEFCNKSFATKSNLNLHKETARFCLQIQGKTNESFKCNICEQVFTTNTNLKHHMKTKCIKEIESRKETDLILSLQKENEKLKENKDRINEQIISDLKKEIEYLKSKLEKDKEEYRIEINKLQMALSQIAVNSKGNTTNIINSNNTTTNSNNSPHLNLNNIEEISNFLEENLNKDVVKGGQKALAKLLTEKYLTKDGVKLYKCTDASRQNFEYIDEKGEVERDVKANKLKKALIEGGVKDKAKTIGKQIWKKDQEDEEDYNDEDIENVNTEVRDHFHPYVLEIETISIDDSKFRSELAVLNS